MNYLGIGLILGLIKAFIELLIRTAVFIYDQINEDSAHRPNTHQPTYLSKPPKYFNPGCRTIKAESSIISCDTTWYKLHNVNRKIVIPNQL